MRRVIAGSGRRISEDAIRGKDVTHCGAVVGFSRRVGVTATDGSTEGGSNLRGSGLPCEAEDAVRIGSSHGPVACVAREYDALPPVGRASYEPPVHTPAAIFSLIFEPIDTLWGFASSRMGIVTVSTPLS